MRTRKLVAILFSSGLVAAIGFGCITPAPARSDITGVVTSSNGPEGGVWVIAETDDLQTRFVKSVVTNDDGRFLIPELPPANYEIWVRGYGLADSDKVNALPGQELQLEAKVAVDDAEAAKVYPANYWYSLIEPPLPDEFPGTGPRGNGIAQNLIHQSQWIDIQKQGCMLCHQLGTRIVREIDNIAQFDSTRAAWDYRIQMGQRGSQMNNVMRQFGRDRGLQMFADWSDRIAKGAIPPKPPRPQGLERNVVVTMWEWGTAIDYIHDEVASDKRDPTINAHGQIYGVNISNDQLSILNPMSHETRNLTVPMQVDPETVPGMIVQSMPVPSRFYGDELIWYDPANPHNPMMDHQGRVWMTSAIRARKNPSWCQEGSDNKFAQYFPLEQGYRGAVYYDPQTEQFVMIDTCFGTHHLQFARDDDHTLFFSGFQASGGGVVGWLKTAVYDQTKDEQLSQGWCPTVIDTNGDGKITKPWNAPGLSNVDRDLNKDTRVVLGSYGVIPDSKKTTAVWIVSTQFPGRLAYLDIGHDPPETCMSEVYEVPSVFDPRVPKEKTGFGPRGLDIDSKGVIWTALSGSSHFASFDRSKCAVNNGPTVIDGRHCVDGWTLYPTPGPVIPSTDPPSRADYHYYNWVDQYNTLGLGEDVPIANGSNSDSLLALMPETKEWIVMRVPYPQGFFTRGLDGRIDDPEAGWKGRGVWATYGSAAPWHIEGGKGVKPGIVKFQVRPDPLAN